MLRAAKAVLLFACVLGLHSPLLAAAEETPKRFDIPSQDLATSLNQFAVAADWQIVFSPEIVRHLRARALDGRYTREEAIRRLLEGTGLICRPLGRGTYAVEAAGSQPAATSPVSDVQGARGGKEALQLAEVETDKSSERSEESGKSGRKNAAAPGDKETEVTVTGSRIRSLLGEQSVQPVMTITAGEIERYGVSSLAEVFRYIPQVSGFELGQEVQNPSLIGLASIDVTSARVSATLRGAPRGGTLLLVNGRRAPKNGQATNLQGDDAYDLSGIPLSAVERIDILLDGASAIYGADAVGGVINVILKKNYRGTEARVGYENTFDTDVSVKTLSLTHGFAAGGFSALATVSWEEANAMMWRDRWFLGSFDRTSIGGPDLRDVGFDFGGAGVIFSATGDDLPGVGSPVVAIPPGSDGVGLTIADYANAGPLPDAFDFGDFLSYASPYRRKGITGSMEYRFNRALTAFGEARWGESKTWVSGTPLVAPYVLVPAGAPGNPFGEPVLLMKYFFDLPSPEDEVTTINRGTTAGVRGEFLHDWRYESAVHEVRSHPDSNSQGVQLDSDLLDAAFAGPNPPVLFYDSTAGASPNPAGALQAFATPVPDGERSRTRSYDIQADGTVFTLPAGEVRMSLGAEYREEHVDFPFPEANLSLQSYNRYTSGYFAELRVPLVSAKQRWPLLDRLEASFAVRQDRYSDFDQATNPRYGLLYRPFPWLMLRASRGEGYKVPTLVQLFRPESEGAVFLRPTSASDPFRGNQPVVASPRLASILFRGNPDLRPERSKNDTAGAVLEMPFIEGLSLSFDYYDTQYLDRVGSVTLADRLVLFPDTVMRGPNLPGDQPGWLGPVIGYEDVSFNIAINRVSGYDLGVSYYRSGGWGDWTVRTTASKTTRNEVRAAPHLPPTATSTTFNLPLQISGSLFWQRGPLGTGVLTSYREATLGTRTTPPSVPSATRWDWQGSYDFRRSGWMASHEDSWWSRVLAGARVSVTIFNVLDEEPPLRSGFLIPDNTVVDSRLRRYAISVTREF